MGRAERVVFTLAALGKAIEAAALAQGPDPVTTTGENLVGIGLVSHIPDQPVVRCIENVMEPQRSIPRRRAQRRDDRP